MNILTIYGDITTEAFSEFDEKLSEFEANEKVKSIIIRIMSDGGHASVGLAFYDRIRLSSLNITTIAYGEVGSAAVLPFLAGNRRIMTENSMLFLHEESAAGVEDKPLSASRRILANLQIVDDKYDRIMSKISKGKMSVEFIKGLNRAETLLSADACLKLNLCTEVLSD